MCGIAGFIDGNLRNPEQVLRKMTDAIVHRGPDDEGVWHDKEIGVALGHRRLSILDLSPAGHQPMLSRSGRYVIVFNGEVYNHSSIRSELESLGLRNWRGHSDTEVMLEAFDMWGIEATVQRLTGMFAIALWDRLEKLLYLIRDRVGEKPLYYCGLHGALIFGSELKALKKHPQFTDDIDRNALTVYMRYCYVPAPFTIYKGVFKVLPGTIVKIKTDQSGIHICDPISYWAAKSVARQGLDNPFPGTDQDAIGELEALLLDAVGNQMVADVPLGAFLSGGIDSSAVVALMQAQSARPVRTFTIGFHNEGYNEAVHAKAVAHHLGTDHTELYVSPSDALSVIPDLPQLYDEPFGDSSQIPTFLVSRMSREHVTVSLSGDGGDELFGGYNRYTWGKSIWKRMSPIPQNIRHGAGFLVTRVSPKSWNALFAIVGPLLPARFRQRLPGDKLHKLAGVLGSENPVEMYRLLASTWKNPGQIVCGGVEPVTTLTDALGWLDCEDIVQLMMFLDLVTYLPDDILVKVDRAAMGVSLETRVPFLDHRVVEFAWKLPPSMKIREGRGKWLLRQILYKHVPVELIERPKMGFGVPIDEWLRGPLRGWAESLLGEHRLRREGFFDPQPISKLWHEHLTGRRNWQHHLWNVLTFQAWLEKQNSAI